MSRGAVAWIAAFLLSLAVQGTLMPLIAIGGITPDAPLITLFFFALRTGPLQGIVAGFLLGLCQDLYGFSLLGQHALAGTLCGWFAGLFNDRVMRIDLVFKGALLIAVFMLHSAVLNAVVIVKNGGAATALFGALFLRTLPSALYSLACVGAYVLWDMFFKSSRRR